MSKPSQPPAQKQECIICGGSGKQIVVGKFGKRIEVSCLSCLKQEPPATEEERVIREIQSNKKIERGNIIVVSEKQKEILSAYGDRRVEPYKKRLEEQSKNYHEIFERQEKEKQQAVEQAIEGMVEPLAKYRWDLNRTLVDKIEGQCEIKPENRTKIPLWENICEDAKEEQRKIIRKVIQDTKWPEARRGRE